MTKEIFIKGLPKFTEKEKLQLIFECFGSIEHIRIFSTKNTPRPLGFAKIKFVSKESAEKALQSQGLKYEDNALILERIEKNRLKKSNKKKKKLKMIREKEQRQEKIQKTNEFNQKIIAAGNNIGGFADLSLSGRFHSQRIPQYLTPIDCSYKIGNNRGNIPFILGNPAGRQQNENIIERFKRSRETNENLARNLKNKENMENMEMNEESSELKPFQTPYTRSKYLPSEHESHPKGIKLILPYGKQKGFPFNKLCEERTLERWGEGYKGTYSLF